MVDMIVLVPDEFREEVMIALADKESLLLDASAKQAHIDRLDEDIRLTLMNAGWSAEFSDWFLTRAQIEKAPIELRVPAKSRYQERMEEYLAARRDKKRLNILGSVYFASGILFRLGLMVGFADKENFRSLAFSLGGEIFLLMIFMGWLLDTVFWFKALFCFLDAKHQSRWWALIGIFIVFVPDKNKLFPPLDSAKAERRGPAVLSEW